MREWVQKAAKSKKFFIVAALLVAMQPVYGVFTAPTAGALSQVVTGNTSTWLFNRDPSTSTPYIFTTTEAKTGHGSLYVQPIGLTPGNKFIAEYFNKTAVEQLKSISYDFQIAGTGTAASADHFYMNVYATIDNSDMYYDCRFDYAPNVGSTTAFKRATFKTTDMPNRVAKRGDRIAACPATLAEMPAGSHMRGFAISVGDTTASDAGLAGYLDNVVVKKTTDTETYDFERELPNAQYQIPSATNNVFRPNDNPVRVKIDDSEQVEKVRFSLYDTTTTTHLKNFTVNRSDCDLTSAGQFVRCDIADANNWAPLTEGAYMVRLTVFSGGEATVRAKMSEYWSQNFTIDATKPTVDSFVLENPVSGITNTNVTVAATAGDTLGVESVNFYMTVPREDGACTGNGAKLTESRILTPSGDGKYRATLDTTALSDGVYCVSVVARDHASNNSVLQHLKVTIDHTGPTLEITSPLENTIFGGNERIVITTDLADPYGLDRYFIDINGVEGLVLDDTTFAADDEDDSMSVSASLRVIAVFNAADFATGQYVATVRAWDKAGNMTEKNLTLFVDHTPDTPGQGETPVGGITDENNDQEDDQLAEISQRLTQPFTVPHSFAAATGGDQVSQEVLGMVPNEDSDVASGETTVAATPSSEGWKIFGIAWYWWLLLAGVLGVTSAWIMRRVRGTES